MVGTSGGEHALLDTLPDGVVVADSSGAVVVINEAASQLLGTGDGVGKHLADVVALQDQAGNDWYTCSAPYDGLPTRTALTEQSWFLSDGTELLVTVRIIRPSASEPVRQVALSLRSAKARAQRTS